MKKILLVVAFICAAFVTPAQTQPMKFMGISLNCTISTFVSKLKGKGFVQDMNNSQDNTIIMKGTFAGEKAKLIINGAAKTHLVCQVDVYFNLSTTYTYEVLKTKLQAKYGTGVEHKNLKEEDGYVKYSTDCMVWETDKDTVSGACNKIILSKCSYRSSSPLIITYYDCRNSKVGVEERDSDF